MRTSLVAVLLALLLLGAARGVWQSDDGVCLCVFVLVCVCAVCMLSHTCALCGVFADFPEEQDDDALSTSGKVDDVWDTQGMHIFDSGGKHKHKLAVHMAGSGSMMSDADVDQSRGNRRCKHLLKR